MNVLALDLGTTFGYAHDCRLASLSLGSVTLATDEEIKQWGQTNQARRCDPRFHRFIQALNGLSRCPSVVIFEDVQFANARKQAHLWATWRAAIWTTYPAENIFCVPTNVLKKFATGNGAAMKPDMARAMVTSSPERFTTKPSALTLKKKRAAHLLYDRAQGKWLDDNAVDAYWLFRWAKENIKK